MNHPARKAHPLGLLHRHGGMVAALAVIVICITGLLLNHTDALRLDERMIRNTALLRWYGIEPPAAQSFAAGSNYITHAGQQLFFNTTTVAGRYSEVRGTVSLDSRHFIALPDTLLILSEAGQIIEELRDYHGIPADIAAIGTSDQHLWLRGAAGVWRSDAGLTNWHKAAAADKPINWVHPVQPPEQFRQQLNQVLLGDGLSFERIILDLHSGRILGAGGRWLGDLVAVLFMALAMSGIWMWFKTRRK